MNPGRLIALALLSMTFCAQGQEQKQYFSNTFFLKITPNTLLDNKGALLPLSVEYSFGGSWGIQADFGVPLYLTLTRQSTKKINKDYRIGGSAKKYFNMSGRTRVFFGLEVAYREQQARWGSGKSVGVEVHTFSSADALWRSTIYTSLFGFSRAFSDHFFFDMQLGLGISHYSIDWYNATDWKTGGRSFSFYTAQDITWLRSGRHDVCPYIPARITFSYRI